MPQPWLVLDGNQAIKICNQEFAKLLRLDIDRLIGRPLARIWADNDGALADELRQVREAQGDTHAFWASSSLRSWQVTGRVLPQDGDQPADLLLVVSPMQAPQAGRAPVQLVQTTRDGRDPHKFQFWHQSTQLLEDARFGEEIGIWRWDLLSNQVSFSARLMNSLGHDYSQVDDLVAFNSSLYHPDDLHQLDEVMQNSVKHGTPFGTVARVRAVDGRYLSILIRGQPVLNDAGETVQLVGIETDISEQVDLSNKLLRAERIAKLGNWSRRLGEETMYWSDALCQIFGLDPETFQPNMRDLDKLFHPEDLELVEKGELRVLQKWHLDPNMVDRIRVRIFRPDGETRYCDISTIVETDIDGKPFELVGTVQDITGLVVAEQQLVAAQKKEVVGQLAGGAAHDFNNLLAVILGNLEMLQEEQLSSSQEPLVNSALKATLRGAELTRNLLSFARKAVLNPRRVNLNDIAISMDDVLRRVFPENIRLEIKSCENCWSVHADRVSFENAVLNLAINARDAMPDGGVVTLETNNMVLTERYIEARHETLQPGPYVVFALSDTGIGMSEALLKNALSPYFSTKPSEQGSGLGLSMVDGFVRQSGGGLRIYSEPNVGTTIKLFFPASALDASMEVDETLTEPDVKASGRVLFAEDNEEVRKIIERRLTEMGLDCTSAETGDKAAEIHAESGPFDLLVTDIVMPGALQGPDLARQLRKQQPDLKVIFITGYPNEATIHGNGLRAEDVRLMKPIGKRDLARAVRALMPI
ncbi:MAG: PAS domain-containing protein [Pelagimonas sp.]|uniref:PAS domain-containing protein n=1 Tax=Pelagimonas sp. TaxID=2073170 RepID=UPI003D6C64A0